MKRSELSRNSRPLRLAIALVGATGLLSCGDAPSPAEAQIQLGGGPSFSQWMAGLKRDVDGSYVPPNECILLHTEDDFQRYYAEHVSRGKLIVEVKDGKDTVWPAAKQRNITFCVQTSAFSSTLAPMITRAMTRAAAEWNRYADLELRYLAHLDSRCSASTTSVEFHVTKGEVSQKCGVEEDCGASAYPNASRSSRHIRFDLTPGVSQDIVDLVAVHELGHMLGFRHEFADRTVTGCPGKETGNTSLRRLTNFDDRSVMMYPFPCSTGERRDLSAGDAAGLSLIYGSGKVASLLRRPGAELVDAFVRGTDGYIYRSFVESGVDRWEQVPGIKARGNPTAFAKGPNRFDVFFRGTDEKLKHAYHNHSWWGYHEMPSSPLLSSDPVAVSHDGARQDVVAVGSDGLLHHWRWSSATNWTKSTSAEFADRFAGLPVMTVAADGTADIVARTTSHEYLHIIRAPDGRWFRSGAYLGGQSNGWPAMVARDGRLDLVFVEADGRIAHRSRLPGDGWRFKTITPEAAIAPTVTISWGPDDRLHVFGRRVSGSLLQWTFDGTDWSSTVDLGGSFTSAPASVDGDLVLMRGLDGQLWEKSIANGWLVSRGGALP